jgi:hypothetical protein
MRTLRYTRNLVALAAATALSLSATGPASGAGPVVYVDQGSKWGQAQRDGFYTVDQGSRLIPLKWAQALKRPDGRPFLQDGLARYGYLPNPNARSGLPVGFMAAGPLGSEDLAMNCSACHTRQIVVGDTQYRIDGGPAIVDFQGLLTDLVAAIGRTLADDQAFAAFAASTGTSPGDVAALKQSVALWHQRESTLVANALPGNLSWGLGRLDAVSMIFNRLAGMDLGPAPSYLIPGNIKPAKAPVRYPFLWNASVQDRTQWPGFAQNGDDLLAKARNLGQVYGVFGVYRPRRDGNRVDFLHENSVDWAGLDRMEGYVKRLGAPKWPWGYDRTLAREGQRVFERDWREGGCAQCHGERRGAFRLFRPLWDGPTWSTPLCDVGTDTLQYEILHRPADSGILKGARRPFGQPLPAETDVFDLLAISVIGSIFQQTVGFSLFTYGAAEAGHSGPRKMLAAETHQRLASVYAPETNKSCPIPNTGKHMYESRVLKGIWAAAPYLHNGSVPTLADLLKPGKDRSKAFRLGNRYDRDSIGLAADQGSSAPERDTKGCGDLNSGESRCGHEFGTNLSDSDKRALLEYLKSI